MVGWSSLCIPFQLSKNEIKVNFIVILFNKGLLYEKLKEADIETFLLSDHKYNFLTIKQIVKVLKEKE